MFYDLGGSGGDGCAFDAAGNLWVADFHRPETGNGPHHGAQPRGQGARLSAACRARSSATSPSAAPDHDEIFCTTGDPPGVFHAKVGVKGFAGHPGKPLPIARYLNVVPLRRMPTQRRLRKIAQVAAEAKLDGGQFDAAGEATNAIAGREPDRCASAQRHGETSADTRSRLPRGTRATASCSPRSSALAAKRRSKSMRPTGCARSPATKGCAVFGRLVEIELNERTDGHKEPVPKKLSDRVTDDWLKQLAGQDQLRRLELSGTAVTSAGLVHLKD